MTQPRLSFAQDISLPSDVSAVRDRIVRSVKQKAEKIDPGFITAACAVIQQYLRDNGRQSGETLTRECKRAGLLPRDDRHFGAAFMRLRKADIIVADGTVKRTRGHRTSGGTLWTLTAKGRAEAA